MRRMFRLSSVLAAGFLVAAVGCTSKSTTTTTTSASPSGSTGASGPAVVDTASSPLGQILVGPSGKTLYLFLADRGTSSTCSSSCATTWPPLLTKGQPTAGPGVTASKLGTTKRTDGSMQVTYAGHPLYYYVGDTKAGLTTGQALNQFGALWYVLNPSGSSITTKPAASAAPTSSSAPAPTSSTTGGY